MKLKWRPYRVDLWNTVDLILLEFTSNVLNKPWKLFNSLSYDIDKLAKQ